MGGTTAKAALVEGGRHGVDHDYEVGGDTHTGGLLTKGTGYPLRVPVVDLAEVGTGGGSIAWADDAGARSTGAPAVRTDRRVAVDAATYFHYGCRFHMAEALTLGATVDEITSALRLSGLAVGFHAPLSAYPLLEEALAEHEATAVTADAG